VTDSEINIAIAESMGWTEISDWKAAGINGLHPSKEWTEVIPNYTADLNACHELEKMLDDKQLARYAQQIIGSARRKMNIPDHESHYPVPFIISATARQRCEAYLKTIGKWIE